jgi:hypothetical protein
VTFVTSLVSNESKFRGKRESNEDGHLRASLSIACFFVLKSRKFLASKVFFFVQKEQEI